MSYENLKKYFLNLLQKRDYSEKEIVDKALRYKYPAEDIKSAIAELKNLNFINDIRFGQNLVEAYQGKKGITWIKQKLMLRKLKKTDIETIVADITTTPVPDLALKSKIERKYKITDWHSVDILAKQKIVRYLMLQGFTNSFEIVKKWVANSE